MDRRLVRDIRVLISAPRRIELAGAVDAEQAVVAGLVQVMIRAARSTLVRV